MTSCEKKIRQKNSGRKLFFFVIFAGFPVQKMQHKNMNVCVAYCLRIKYFDLKADQKCQ